MSMRIGSSYVVEVLDVQGRQWEVVGDTVSGDPHVVHGPRPPSEYSGDGKDTVGVSHVFVTGNHWRPGHPLGEKILVTRTPVADLSPLGQLGARDEGNDRLGIEQLGGKCDWLVAS